MKTSKVIICSKCKGLGKTQESELEDNHHRTRRYWDEVCYKCGGHGRVVELTEITERKLTEEELKVNPQE